MINSGWSTWKNPIQSDESRTHGEWPDSCIATYGGWNYISPCYIQMIQVTMLQYCNSEIYQVKASFSKMVILDIEMLG